MTFLLHCFGELQYGAATMGLSLLSLPLLRRLQHHLNGRIKDRFHILMSYKWYQ